MVHRGGKAQWLNRYFNPGAFTINAPGTFGNSGRNILQGPGTNTADIGVDKNWRIRERGTLQFRWEMFNAFNRANFNNPNAVVGSSAAGTVSATYPSRSMQLGLKATF